MVRGKCALRSKPTGLVMMEKIKSTYIGCASVL